MKQGIPDEHVRMYKSCGLTHTSDHYFAWKQGEKQQQQQQQQKTADNEFQDDNDLPFQFPCISSIRGF